MLNKDDDVIIYNFKGWSSYTKINFFKKSTEKNLTIATNAWIIPYNVLFFPLLLQPLHMETTHKTSLSQHSLNYNVLLRKLSIRFIVI